MVKRFAAHFVILPDGSRRYMHGVELDTDKRLRRVFPIDKETEATAFFNGTMLLKADESQRISVYYSEDLDLSAAKFGADDSGGDSHIQRLC